MSGQDMTFRHEDDEEMLVELREDTEDTGVSEMTVRRGTIEMPREDWFDNRPEETFQLFAISEQKATEFQAGVEGLSRILAQMGQMMAAMQRRLDDMEARQAAVTVSHGDVKKLNARIRYRADELCRKYSLTDPGSVKAFRAAIRKDLLTRYQVRDLHDLPAASLAGAENTVDSWVNIRLAMERRGACGRV